MESKVIQRIKKIFESDSTERHDLVLFNTKKNLLYQIISLTIFIGAIIVTIGYVESIILGQLHLTITYPLLFFPLIVVGLWYNRISYKQSIHTVLICVYLFGLSNLLVYSINGASIPIFMLLLALATVFLGLKAGFSYLLLCLISMAIVGYLFVSGITTFEVSLIAISTSFIAWVTAMSVLAFLGFIIMISFSLIQDKMLKEHELTVEQSAKLNELNKMQKEDLEKLNEAKQKLKVSNANFQDVVSNISTVIWKADVTAEGIFENVYLSEVANTLLKLPAGSISDNWEAFLNYAISKDRVKVMNAIKDSLGNCGKLIIIEYRVMVEGKKQIWLQLRMKSTRQDEQLRIFGTISNVTRRKRAELENIKYKNNLERQVDERTRELNEQKDKLIELNQVFVGREYRIKELREQVKDLKKEIKALQ